MSLVNLIGKSGRDTGNAIDILKTIAQHGSYGSSGSTTSPKKREGLFKTKNPNNSFVARNVNNSYDPAMFWDNPIEGGDVAGMLAKHGIPVAALLAGIKQTKDAREKAKVNLVKPTLFSGRVRDMQKPTFALRSREPMGSSLAEATAGQKYRDAYSRAQEAAFTMNNEQFKIAQENQITGRKNQNEGILAQIENQQRLANANIYARDYLMRRQNNNELLLGLHHNINSDLAQNASFKANKEAPKYYTDIMASGRSNSMNDQD